MGQSAKPMCRSELSSCGWTQPALRFPLPTIDRSEGSPVLGLVLCTSIGKLAAGIELSMSSHVSSLQRHKCNHARFEDNVVAAGV